MIISTTLMLLKSFLVTQSALAYTPWSPTPHSPVASYYSVPVKGDLHEFARFSMEGSAAAFGETETVIRYCLPRDIVGERDVHIELKGEKAVEGQFFAVTEADHATTGQCIKAGATLTCVLQYASLEFDVDANEAFLARKYADDVNFPKRLSVMRAFSGDAVGILSLDLE